MEEHLQLFQKSLWKKIEKNEVLSKNVNFPNMLTSNNHHFSTSYPNITNLVSIDL